MHCYSRTFPQRPPWEKKKVAVVERWPLLRGRGVIWQIFLESTTYLLCYVTKRARFAAFAVSIVDNLCLLQSEYKWSTVKIQLPRLIMPYASNVMTILDFLSIAEKNWPLLRGYFR